MGNKSKSIMEWIQKSIPEGIKRVVFAFPLIPKELNGVVKWLCLCKKEQYYYGGDYYDSPAWIDSKWV